MHSLTKLLYVSVHSLLKRLGLLTREEAISLFKAEALEAIRIQEEALWHEKATIELERKELEYQGQMLEHDLLSLRQYALSIGVPMVEDRPTH
jgi:hypothetical protein